MAQIVKAHPRDTGAAYPDVERSPDDPVVERGAETIREHEVVRVRPSAAPREAVASLVRLLGRECPATELTDADDSRARGCLYVGERALPRPLADDASDTALGVDVMPLEAEQIALPESGRDRERVQGRVPVTRHGVEERVDLGRRPRHSLRSILHVAAAEAFEGEDYADGLN